MALRFLSGSNGFLPEATGQVIAFIRKPETFRLNQYVQYVETPKVIGVYAELGRDEPVRVPTDAEFAWEDGDERPAGDYHQVPFQWTEFRTYRRDYPWRLGWQAIEQAGGGWKPKAVHAAMAASKAMTNRAIRVITLMEATANWGDNTATANTLNSGKGKWGTGSDDPNSPNYFAIGASLLEAARRIELATNGVVTIDQLKLVVSPGLAIAMSKTAEIRNYLRESPFAMAQVKGDSPNMNKTYGLPSHYQGFEVVVENTVKVTERAKASGTQATTARVFAKADTSACIVSRVGGIDGDYGAPSFSTIQCYHHGGLLKVSAFDDARNERVDGHVEENFKEVVAASPSGFLITATM